MMDYEITPDERGRDYTKPYVSGLPGPINLGNPREVSILEIAKKILELTGSKSELIFEKLPEDDPKRRCPDISKAKKYLEWEPVVPLEEGLIRTIEYFMAQKKTSR
ncbi:MAG TPA: hypothetical protein PLW88_04745 [Syntrophorhabdaceae bacterium]|nr:hypothetical protein [Syntrophorhabdaceae bacterium]